MKSEFEDALKGFHRDYTDAETDEFVEGYKPIGTLPVVSLLFAVLSMTVVFGWGMMIVPLIAMAAGGISLRRIMRSPDVLGGFGISIAGVSIAVVWVVIGSVYLTWSYYNEVPSGYRLITFESILADPKTGELPKPILELIENKQPVFIEGYMYPGKHLNNLDRFVLVESNERSSFQRPDREPTESILIEMTAGQTVSHRSSPVRVGGTMIINEDRSNGESPYLIQADIFR
ncbi:MAG: hypothetical protein LBU65_13395 [Planctomycetaceae bacterium]|jgi:hypothetical protein|nr:hypothetical protein [Planctomycetaceae bacterium]